MKPVRWLIATLALTACARAAAAQPGPLPTPTSASLAPTADPPPTATATVTPSPTPVPVLRQLTTGGCCVQPFWSANSAQVWFIDKPSENDPSGIWGVDVTGGAPHFITDRLGVYSPDGSLIAYPEAGQAYVERLSDGERWVAPSDGSAISFSPDSQHITWQAVSVETGAIEVWMATVDGSAARIAARLTSGSFSGWFPDGARLLVSGRGAGESTLGALRLSDGALTIFASAPRLRGGTLSPGGGWLAYQVTFSGDPALDGLWVARTDGSGTTRLDVFGTYRWRSEGMLLVIPLEAGEVDASHRLLEVGAATGEVIALTDPALTPFRVAGGDWAPSPDGRRVVFVSAADHNLWLLELGE